LSQKTNKNHVLARGISKPYEEKTESVLPLVEDGVLAYSLKTGKNQDENLMIEIQSNNNKGITLNQ